jgi:DNA-binding NtrC family response regulator
MKIMIIEDDVSKKETIEKLVVHSGHVPCFVRSAAEGLRLFETGKFDMVLSELGMLADSRRSPEGIVMEYLNKRSPVTIISSIQDEYAIEHFARMGAVEFMTKPISIEKLESICDRYK